MRDTTSPRSRLSEALDRLVYLEQAHARTGDAHYAGLREAAWAAAVATVEELAARGELGWLTQGQVAHYLRRQGADARAFVVQHLVPRIADLHAEPGHDALVEGSLRTIGEAAADFFERKGRGP